MDPDEIEKILAAKIENSLKNSPDDTLLGFLEVSQTLQNEVLRILRESAEFDGLKKLLKSHPAVAAYGLAVAAPIGLTDEGVGGGAFYGAWKSAFGCFPSQPEREPLARAFIYALYRLGLQYGTISPDREIHWHGGCYLFHSAILPHFVEPLRNALKAAQKVRPMPDPDDEEMSAAFANILAVETHPAQQRLKKVLESKVGSFLVKRLVRWHLTGDNSLFPTHIQPLLAEQKGHVPFLRNPYISFDETEGRLQLVLPAQTSAIADAQTRWLVGEDLTLRASSERPPIPLDEITSEGKIEVKLSLLRDGREDVIYRLDNSFSAEHQFRLFDAVTGKERKIPEGDTIELTPGENYLIVFDASISILSDHVVESVGGLRYVRLEILPRSEPLVLKGDARSWSLKPKIRPGLFFSRDEARVFHVNRIADKRIIPVVYGEAVELTCCIAKDLKEQPKITFTSTTGTSRSLEPSKPDSAAVGMILYDVGTEFQNWLQSLQPAVQIITVTLESDGRKMTQEFYFWKGLERISMYGDFYCASLPKNLAQYSGFEKRDSAIIRKVGNNSRPELAFRNLGLIEVERWEVPANRVKVVVVRKEGSTTELNESSEIDVLPDDDRVIQFITGGLLPIRLIVNGTPLGEISPDKPVLARFLSSLVADFGKAGEIKAECVTNIQEEKPWTVLLWRTPQVALECRSEDSINDLTQWLIRKIGLRGVSAFRIKLTDVAKRIQNVESDTIYNLDLPKEIGDTNEVELYTSLTCTVLKQEDETGQIQISFIQSAHPGMVWLLEVECLLDGNTIWQPLMCCEAHSRLSFARIFLIGKASQEFPPSVFTELFWSRPGGQLPSTAISWKLNGAEFSHWLDTARWMIEARHPLDVWKQYGVRLMSLYERISAVGLRVDQAQKTQWWSHAISTLNEHAAEPQPIIVPCLLMSRGWEMASTSLVGCSPMLPSIGIVSRTFQEAFAFDNKGDQHDLGYVRSACKDRRIDVDYLTNFAGWNQIIQNRPVCFGKFHYNTWLDSQRKQVLPKNLWV